jgi:hypothetical protein
MLGVGCFVAFDMFNSLTKYLPPLQTCSVVRKLSQPQCTPPHLPGQCGVSLCLTIFLSTLGATGHAQGKEAQA